MKTEIVNTKTGEISKMVAISDPFEMAKLMTKKNDNIPVSVPSFSFDELEDEINKNPTIVYKMQKEINERLENHESLKGEEQISNYDKVIELTAKLRRYHRKRCRVIEIGEVMYSYDAPNKPKVLTRFFKFRDLTSNEVFIMRQTMALSNIDYLNEMRFKLANSKNTNAESFDKNTLYSDFLLVDITFIGFKKSKTSGGKYHLIEIKNSKLD